MSAAIRTETAHPRRTIRSVAAVLAGIAVADLPLGPTGIRSPSSPPRCHARGWVANFALCTWAPSASYPPAEILTSEARRSQKRRSIVVLTKDELVEKLQHEVRILLHLALG
jgi:hypothetical protein